MKIMYMMHQYRKQIQYIFHRLNKTSDAVDSLDDAMDIGDIDSAKTE